jgi:hypothetical protein
MVLKTGDILTEDIKKCDDSSESCSTTEVPEKFPTVATSLG